MSIDCTIYDLATGIAQPMSLSHETLQAYAERNFGFIFGVQADPQTHYVDLATGTLAAYTIEELAARAVLGSGWIWRMPERAAVDQRMAEQARAAAIARINAERDSRIAAFDRFTFEGVAYDGDAAAKENISDAAAGVDDGLPLPDGFTWRTFDNEDVPMTGSDVLALAKAFRAAANLHKFTMHAIARALKDGAEGDLTNAQLDAITWPQ